VTDSIEPPSSAELAQLEWALESANIPTLVPVLYQLTGDRRWLEAPYAPKRTKGMDDNATGGLPEDIRAELRAATARAVRAWAEGEPVAIPAPTDDALVELTSVCMGETVPPEYEPMIAADMGFRPVEPRTPAAGSPVEDFTTVIVGAGISGLLTALKLKRAGLPFVILECNDEVGGTWFDNRYPGCGVDTPSYLYSFSFFPRAWSRHFARRDELNTYLNDLTDHFGLRPYIRFGMRVHAARWDEQALRWRVQADDRDGTPHEFVGNALVSAVGQLNRPKLPDIPGFDEFTGPAFHSARWPDGLDAAGKRVAVVGTGASAMQVVPAIAPHAEHVTVFQRSPQWITPNELYFQPVGEQVHWLMDHVPYYHHWYRFRLSWTFMDKVHPSLQIDPSWPHPERSVNAINDAHREYFTRYLLDSLDGRPDLQEKALPTYPPFGKRMLLDNGWFTALRRDNVELVTEAVTALTAGGVQDLAGDEHEVDMVVFATGFEAQKPLTPLNIRGRSGRSIRDHWGEDNPQAYLSITAPDFPNMFICYGPAGNLGHGGSFIVLAESQSNYIVDMICQLVERGIEVAECRQDVCDAYNKRLDEAHNQMIWTHQGMDTWYRNSHGRVVTTMPWRVLDFWNMTRHADLDEYEVGPRG
jgi:4-hydroxyacetophenone monooxygenase